MADTNNSSARKKRLPLRPILAIAIIAIIALSLWWFLRPRNGSPEELFTGYVVSNNVYMTSPIAGTLTSVSVERGQRVKADDPLFRIDPTVREAQTEQARAVILANEAQVKQQEAALSRANSDLAAAQSDAEKFAVELRRLAAAQREKLGSVAQLEIDQTRASYDAALKKSEAARAQLSSASAAIAAAQAQVKQSQAGLTSAQRELDDLAPRAPSAGRVEDVMFKPGESVTPNVPVVSIVPDGQVKVRFYVPQALVSKYKPGTKVAIGCDGCEVGMSATVEFVATEPEYTPPVIYSLEARQKLVFLVEAIPANARALIPGQPMDVAPNADALPKR